jgi:hypothetical protein
MTVVLDINKFDTNRKSCDLQLGQVACIVDKEHINAVDATFYRLKVRFHQAFLSLCPLQVIKSCNGRGIECDDEDDIVPDRPICVMGGVPLKTVEMEELESYGLSRSDYRIKHEKYRGYSFVDATVECRAHALFLNACLLCITQHTRLV